MSELHQRIHNAVNNPQLQTNYYKATATAVAKNRLRREEPERLDQLRKEAEKIRRHTIDHLAFYLEKAEQALQHNGMYIHWAVTAQEAREIGTHILKQHNVKKVVKAKSMLTEELELNDWLALHKIQSLETDLGEFIIQVAGEKPSHITAPAIHKSVGEIAQLFHEKFGIEYTEDEHVLTEFARNALREHFLTAEAGISGANFLLADSGTICLVENEGNIRLSVTAPKLHIAFIGIEKVVPDQQSLAVLLELLGPSATGQDFPCYFSMIRKPEQGREIHVIFVDNRRTRIWQNDEFRPLLHCIRCGACMNSCPVYQHVGGHAYGWIYPGPIGALLTPLMRGHREDEYLPFMSTLCGMCTDVCPVKIPLHHLLLKMRQKISGPPAKPFSLDWAMKQFRNLMLKPRRYERLMKLARFFQHLIPGSSLPVPGLNRFRKIPKLSRQMFRSDRKRL